MLCPASRLITDLRYRMISSLKIVTRLGISARSLLGCNMMRSLYRFLEEDGDELLLGWLWKVPVVFVATVSLLGRWLYVPYGRYGDHRSRIPLPAMVTSVKLPARQVWLIQEIPSLAVPLFLLLNVGGRFVGAVNPNIVLLGMFLLHYVNR